MKRILLASLLAAGVALPGVASAHSYGPDRYDYDRGYDNHYRHQDRWDRDRHHDRDRDHWRAERRHDRYEWRHHYRHHDHDWRY
jgi:Ni/Co efflux regulator RcnB